MEWMCNTLFRSLKEGLLCIGGNMQSTCALKAYLFNIDTFTLNTYLFNTYLTISLSMVLNFWNKKISHLLHYVSIGSLVVEVFFAMPIYNFGKMGGLMFHILYYLRHMLHKKSMKIVLTHWYMHSRACPFVHHLHHFFHTK